MFSLPLCPTRPLPPAGEPPHERSVVGPSCRLLLCPRDHAGLRSGRSFSADGVSLGLGLCDCWPSGHEAAPIPTPLCYVTLNHFQVLTGSDSQRDLGFASPPRAEAGRRRPLPAVQPPAAWSYRGAGRMPGTPPFDALSAVMAFPARRPCSQALPLRHSRWRGPSSWGNGTYRALTLTLACSIFTPNCL